MNGRTFQIGVGLFQTVPPQELRDLVHLAERDDYDNVWFGDSQNIWRELYTSMVHAAAGTTRVTLGTAVTNARSRHVAVIASAFCTMNEMFPGRMVLGLGPGDSSLETLGLSPMRLDDLETAVTQLRSLIAGDVTSEPGSDATFRLSYLTEPALVPLYLAVSGPRMIQLAGRISDGVIISLGCDRELLEYALEQLDIGLQASGRTRDDIDIVLWTPASISEHADDARNAVRGHVARLAKRPFPIEFSAEEEAMIRDIRENYDYYGHMDATSRQARLVGDALVDRFALAGTPDQCAERLHRIAPLVDQVAIVPFASPSASRADIMTEFARMASTTTTTSTREAPDVH